MGLHNACLSMVPGSLPVLGCLINRALVIKIINRGNKGVLYLVSNFILNIVFRALLHGK